MEYLLIILFVGVKIKIMKLIRIIFFTFLFSNTLFSQVEKIIYFNLKWEKTTKDKASYYRKLPLKEKEGKVLIKDYYMSGAIQMQERIFLR